MKKEEIKNTQTVIVSGLTRCGSSMTMQMLHAGGMPISCAPGNESVSGEHDSQIEALKILATKGANGMAIKCLDPHRFVIPKGNYIIFWCCRDYDQQAKSICKFMEGMLGIKTDRTTKKSIRKSLPEDTKKCLKKLEKLGPVHKFLFEDTLLDPPLIAASIANILKDLVRLDVAKMANVVYKRSSDCADGFLIESMLVKKSNEL